MNKSDRFKIICIVLAVVIGIFSLTPQGQWLTDTLTRGTKLVDFQNVCQDYPFSLHVLDVGKADAICIAVDGEYILIDGGTAANGKYVADYLERLGVRELAVVFNTHPDDDHIGGLATVLQRFPCSLFCRSSVPADVMPDTQDVRAVQRILSEQSVPTQFLKAGNVLVKGNLRIEILSPGKDFDSSNNSSLVLRLQYGSHRFLLMGDAEREVEEYLLQEVVDLSADVLKVGHHGSNTSTTEVFLHAVMPRFAVISTGEDNNHLPRIPVLNRLDICEELYRTDTDGTVIFCSDGEELDVYTKYNS